MARSLIGRGDGRRVPGSGGARFGGPAESRGRRRPTSAPRSPRRSGRSSSASPRRRGSSSPRRPRSTSARSGRPRSPVWPRPEEAAAAEDSGRARDRPGGDLDGRPRARRSSARRPPRRRATSRRRAPGSWSASSASRPASPGPAPTATLALQALATDSSPRAAAAAAVRADLLDTYQARLRASLEAVTAAAAAGLRR